MKNKLWLLGILTLLIISMFAYLAVGARNEVSNSANPYLRGTIYNVNTSTNVNFWRPHGSLTELSGAVANLSGTQSITVYLYQYVDNASAVAAGDGGVNYTYQTNVSMMWQLNSDFSFKLNSTMHNYTCGLVDCANITLFNFSSIDTTSLPDGRYNITFMVLINETTGAVRQKYFNVTGATNITIDNTAPTVGPLSFNATFSSSWGSVDVTFSDGTLGFFGTERLASNVTINFSLIGDNLTGVNYTVLMFDNATGNNFNITVINGTTNFGSNRNNFNGTFYGMNLSTFWGGRHTVTALVYDFAGNVNNANSISFTVNTAPNVTIYDNSTNSRGLHNLQYGNFSKSGINLVTNFAGLVMINFSVGNMTVNKYVAALGNVSVTLSFDNATTSNTTSAFNVTAYINGQSRDGFNNITIALNNNQPVVYFNFTLNVSTLKEGRHIGRILANDSKGNFNYTTFYNFTVDYTAPAITVTCDSSKTPGQTVSCTCTAADSLSGVKVAAKFQGDSDASESTTASSVGSFTTSACVATDYANNVGSGSGTYTIVAASSTGGGGSGGSGGGSSTGSTGTFESKTWTSIYEGETATVEIDEGLGVTKVEFKVNDDVYGATVRVTKRDSFPSTVSDPEGKVYRKLEIYAGPSLKEGVVGDRNVFFKVEKSWLTENSVDKSEVVLLRYVDNKWTSLPTTVEGDEADSVSYKAVTPGFSYFVIGTMAGAGAVEETPTGEVAGAPTGEAEVAEETGGVGSTALVVVLVLVVVLAVVFFIYKKRKM